jgi:multicomponent Na+:H+ antiporter subunit F
MQTFMLAMGIVLCLTMLLTLFRVVSGPTVIDRLMSANVIGTKTTVLLIVIGMIYQRVDMFVDIALAYALLNFIVTVAAARYFQHHKNLHVDGFGFTLKREPEE